MGDSDDEYERRRRDKFRGERSDYAGGRDRRDDNRRREDWGGERREGWGGRDRGTGSRREYGGRDYGRARERYSPVRHDMSPPMKRMRPDWEERRYPYEASYGGTNYGGAPNYGGPTMPAAGHDYPPQHSQPPPHGGRMDELGPTQPPMMSFKAFMEQCDDSISEEEALRKYSDYKMDFKRQQLNEFFVSHKEEEWFKAKYHPEECVQRKEEQIANLKRRISVFTDLDGGTYMEMISVDADQSDQLLKLLDSVVIKLEGGSDIDLQVLDQVNDDDILRSSGIIGFPISSIDHENKTPIVVNVSDSETPTKDSEKGGGGNESKDEDDVDDEDKQRQEKAKALLSKKVAPEGSNKRKRSSDSESSSSSSSSEEEPPPGMEEKKKDEVVLPAADKENKEKEGGKEDTPVKEKEPPPPGMEAKKVVKRPEEAEEGELNDKGEAAPKPPVKEIPVIAVLDDDKEESMVVKPRALHKTASIFLRNLAPTITKQEVEAMCRRYPGFLRAAIADPQPERRWFRRGWVSFKREVNIKDICWNLNNIRLRDCELGAIVNRDLARRIRTVNGITSHKAVVKSDIKLAAKIIQNLDTRWGLWIEMSAESESIDGSLSNTVNPVMSNITDYLIEEASAEEDELLGTTHTESNGTNGDMKAEGEPIERDPALIKVLDRLLLYLRIVHSVDYYNHSEYPNEDEMPNRCGIMHARGIPPSSKVTPQEIHDYSRAFENKIGSFLQPLTKLNEDEAKRLGLKNPNDEVLKFIQSNSQEVAKEKWQCPLCGKKFKAEEFVHKHISNKHQEKVSEVEKEVDYFNNYLRDPKRPQLPEYPGPKGSRKDDMRSGDPYVAAYPQPGPGSMYGAYGSYPQRYQAQGGYGGGQGFGGGNNYPKDFYNRSDFNPNMRGSEGGYGGRPRATYRSRSTDPRGVIGYHDLDVPDDIERF